MSNRVYLYSTNFVPGAEAEERRIVPLNEWGNDIPIGFKLFLSGSPRKCPSLVFEPPVTALIGDYETGVSKFFDFLDTVPHPYVSGLKTEAREFFSAPATKNPYILLEPEEYFWLDGGDTDAILAELADLEPQKKKAIAEIKARLHEELHPPGFFARLFGTRAPVRKDDSNDLVVGLGLGAWGHTLFCDPK